jgi:thioredoxin-dependent peroxiredoxin
MLPVNQQEDRLMNVSVGDPAPDFTLPDQRGNPWTLSAQKGEAVVLYFYPKDDTPGCTNQACDVRDHWSDFEALGVVVAGISPDSVDDHARFADKYGLPHLLLADPERAVIERYGVWGERSLYGKRFMGVLRSSVVVDRSGTVAAVFAKIKPAEQSAKALEAIRALQAS